MSGNGIKFPELPMTQKWRGPDQLSCKDTAYRAGSRLVFWRDGTEV